MGTRKRHDFIPNWGAEYLTFTREAMIEGQILQYHVCSEQRTLDEEKFHYLGKGTIYRINRVLQKGEKKEFHFYFRRDAPVDIHVHNIL